MGSWMDWTGKNLEMDFNGKTVDPPKALPSPDAAPTMEQTIKKKKSQSFLAQAYSSGRKDSFLTGARGAALPAAPAGKTQTGV
jgi:hypothetical protein